MKKNISINMFGQLFNIDEDAYQVLSRYLESMKQYFVRREGGSEIAEDIERHVAELMWQHSQNGTQPVSIEDVNAIISQIGNPSEIDNSDSESTAGTDAADRLHNAWNSFQSSMSENLGKRRLFRDPYDTIIGGVLSGLSRYFGWESPTLLRLVIALLMAFSLFFGKGFYFGIILLAYLLLMVIVPKPQNAEDRLKMQGKTITPDALNQEMLRESTDAVQSEQRSSNPNNGCLLSFLKLLLFFLLLPFIFFGALILFVIIMVFVGMAGALGTLIPITADDIVLPFFDNFLAENHMMVGLALLSLLLVIVLPIVIIVRAVNNRNKEGGKSHTWLFILLFMISLALLITSSVSLFLKGEKYLRERDEEETKMDTLVVDTPDSLLEAIPYDEGVDSTAITLSSDTTNIVIKHVKKNKK